MRHGTGRAIVVVDAEPECSLIWELLADGADDVLTWNPDDTPSAIVSRFRRWREIDRVLASPGVADIIVGESPALRSALVEVVEHAVYGNGPIVLVGETGTGKELAARLVHQVSAHARGAAAGDPGLHDDRALALGQRAVRPRAWCIHRGRAATKRCFRRSERRHAVPGRDR